MRVSPICRKGKTYSLVERKFLYVIGDALNKQIVIVRESSTNTFLIKFDLDLYFNSNAYSDRPIYMFLSTVKVVGYRGTQRSQYYFDQGYLEKKSVFLTGENYFYIALSDIRFVDNFDINSQVSSIATKYDLTNLQGFVLYDGINIITRYVDNQTINSLRIQLKYPDNQLSKYDIKLVFKAVLSNRSLIKVVESKAIVLILDILFFPETIRFRYNVYFNSNIRFIFLILFQLSH